MPVAGMVLIPVEERLLDRTRIEDCVGLSLVDSSYGARGYALITLFVFSTTHQTYMRFRYY